MDREIEETESPLPSEQRYAHINPAWHCVTYPMLWISLFGAILTISHSPIFVYIFLVDFGLQSSSESLQSVSFAESPGFPNLR